MNSQRPRRAHRLTKPAIRGIIVFFLCLTHLAALAQPGSSGDLPPNVASDYLDRERELTGDTLHVCLSRDGLLADFERDLAAEIGSVLLIDVVVLELAPFRSPPILDYRFAVSAEELLVTLFNDCQAMLGFLLAPGRTPAWMTMTRPYLETDFALATTDQEAASLGDLPPDYRIGTRMLSDVDLRFLDFNLARRESRQWRRVMYTDNRLLLDRLQSGDLEAVLMWEPALVKGLGGDLEGAGVRNIDPAPFTPPRNQFGAVLLERDAYLRSMLDDAFGALIADGAIERLLDRHGIPGRAPGAR